MSCPPPDTTRGTKDTGLANTDVAGEPPEAGAPAIELERGASIGRFIVIDEIGAGSMGIVLSAFDPQLDRKVAIKVVRPGLGRAAALRERLVREAQAMARLSHPAVITVYEVGVIGDGVFVAMELVPGGTLSTWLAAERRTWREVLALCLRAGGGLAAAHAAGLVHRDFKPDNVLVGDHGRVRVTDFGQAGTPLYMAPEQHEGRTVDARADQFAFCVTLYQALYGTLPFGGAGHAELAEQVGRGRVREPPPEAAVPARIRRVVVRGLSADPAARYPSMVALLADLERDPGRTRRRAALAAAGVALVAWGGLALWQSRLARGPTCAGAEQALAGVWDAAVKDRVRAAFLATKAPYAGSAWQGVSRRLDDYAGAWARMHTEACEATRSGAQSEHALDLRMACLSRRRTELAAMTGLFTAADAAVVEKALSAASSLTDVRGCADLERLAASMPLPEDVATRVQIATVRAELAVADAYQEAGKYRAAFALAEAWLDPARASRYRPVEAEDLFVTGRLHRLLGEPAAAEKTLYAAVAVAAAAPDDEVEADAYTELVRVVGDDLVRPEDGLRSAKLAAAILTRLHDDPVRKAILLLYEGFVLDRSGAHDEARQRFEAALALARKIHEPGHLQIASIVNGLGTNAYRMGIYEVALTRYLEALALFEREFGPDHPYVALMHTNIGLALYHLGELESALASMQHSLDIKVKVLGADHPAVPDTLNNIGGTYVHMCRYALAASSYQRAVEITERINPDSADEAYYRANLGQVLLDQGKHDAAVAEWRRALSTRQRSLGKEHFDTARSHRQLADGLVAQGHDAEALEHLQHARAIFAKTRGQDSVEVAVSLDAMGDLAGRAGKHAPALELLERARGLLAKTAGDSANRALNHYHLGLELARTGAHARAIEELRLALDVYARAPESPWYNGPSLVAMAQSQLALGAPRDAIASLERAVAVLERCDVDPRRLAEARSWLARAEHKEDP